MGKKKLISTGRAWNFLRLALIWARKGGAFKRWHLHVIRNHLKSLWSAGGPRSADRIGYGEREFSFDETPMFHFRMHRPPSMRMPRIPCINAVPLVDFDGDDDGDVATFGRKSCRSCEGEIVVEEEEFQEEDGIDSKAEEFIARFYEQMKLQRQISLLQYHEILDRSLN